MNGPNRVTEGYEVKVDLADAWIVIPRLGLPGTCDGISKFPSPMRTVFKDNNAPTVPDWAETSIYGSRLAINGSFFEVVGYYGTGDLHTEVCTHVFGYVVSNKELVRPEEQIKVYQMNGRPTEYYDGATLVFYTSAYTRTSGRYAEIKEYPMFPGTPSKVPPEYQNAITGTKLLKNGVHVGDSATGPGANCRLARTAVGLSSDGRYLIMVVVSPSAHGNCAHPNNGTTLASLATYIKSLGANDAILLDGGGSSQMFYTNYRQTPIRSLASDSVRGPGFDPSKRYYRPVANFLGIR